MKRDDVIEQIRPILRAHFRKGSTWYRHRSSYGLKKIIQRLLGQHIYEQEFIEGAELEGFERKPCPWNPEGFIYKITGASIWRANDVSNGNRRWGLSCKLNNHFKSK